MGGEFLKCKREGGPTKVLTGWIWTGWELGRVLLGTDVIKVIAAVGAREVGNVAC